MSVAAAITMMNQVDVTWISQSREIGKHGAIKADAKNSQKLKGFVSDGDLKTLQLDDKNSYSTDMVALYFSGDPNYCMSDHRMSISDVLVVGSTVYEIRAARYRQAGDFTKVIAKTTQRRPLDYGL
jgi:hypothetical protein